MRKASSRTPCAGPERRPAKRAGAEAADWAKAAKHGVPNARFVWAAVERLPPELTGVTELHVIMPWGSLLRALVAPEPDVLAGLAGACRPGARFQIALNLHAWRPPVPALAGIPEPDPDSVRHRLATAYRAAGWHLERAAYLTDPEIDALHSSWARRLRSSRPGRPVRGQSADAGSPPEQRQRTWRRFEVLELTGTITGAPARTGPDAQPGADGVS